MQIDHRDRRFYPPRVFYIIWNKKVIFELLTKISVYSIENLEEFTIADRKLKYVMTFTNFLRYSVYFSTFSCEFFAPFTGNFFQLRFFIELEN